MTTLQGVQGKTLEFETKIEQADGTAWPLDPVNDEFWVTAKWSLDDADADAVFQLTKGAGITVVGDGSTGVIRWESQPGLLSTKTVLLHFDVQYKPAGDQARQVDSGLIRLRPPATKAS